MYICKYLQNIIYIILVPDIVITFLMPCVVDGNIIRWCSNEDSTLITYKELKNRSSFHRKGGDVSASVLKRFVMSCVIIKRTAISKDV